MRPNGMQPWRAQEDLQRGLRRRVALQDGADVFVDAIEHWGIPGVKCEV
jgi:hypothetical protein